MKIDDAEPIAVFNADTELAFFRACCDWAFPLHFTLAKTGLRVGELVHLLIEDLDLDGGWLHVRNKVELGWRITNVEETVLTPWLQKCGYQADEIGVALFKLRTESQQPEPLAVLQQLKRISSFRIGCFGQSSAVLSGLDASLESSEKSHTLT